MKRHLKSAHAPNTVKKECDQCDATFTSDGALRNHVRLSHERVFQSRKDSSSKMDNVKQCSECDKKITKRNSWSHRKDVDKLTIYNTSKAEILVYAFKCEMCSFSAKRRYDLKRHVMQKHSKVDVSFP